MSVSIEFLIQNIINGRVYDVSEIVSTPQWETNIEFSAGSLRFDMKVDPNVKVNEGDIVRFSYNGIKIFFGKVFTKKKSSKVLGWSITCYDQMRYLKNKDTLVVGPLSSSELFTRICREQELPFKVINASPWKAPSIVYDDKSLFDMLQDSLDKTLINYGMWYIIRDNFGVLEHVALNSLITNVVIGDGSLAQDFDYESSIDEASNQVKLYRDNKDTGKRDVYIVRDSKTIAHWGKLQFTEKVDENMNPAQIRERANYIHKSLNKPKKSLKIPCKGFPLVRAGTGVILSIADLVSEGFDKQQLAVVKKATHKWEGDGYQMDLEVVVV